MYEHYKTFNKQYMNYHNIKDRKDVPQVWVIYKWVVLSESSYNRYVKATKIIFFEIYQVLVYNNGLQNIAINNVLSDRFLFSYESYTKKHVEILNNKTCEVKCELNIFLLINNVQL